MNQTLAQIARVEASKNYHGDTPAAIGNLQPLLAQFDGCDLSEDVCQNWSGVFLYHCVRLAGSLLPPKYPDSRVHSAFDRVEAWWEYARLPKIHSLLSPALIPEVGDLAVFRQPGNGKPLIGVVLAVGEGTLELAAGDYHNHSALVELSVVDSVMGYIRLHR